MGDTEGIQHALVVFVPYHCAITVSGLLNFPDKDDLSLGSKLSHPPMVNLSLLKSFEIGKDFYFENM